MLGVIYRAEYTNLIHAEEEECLLEENIRKATETANNNILIVGDFNVNLFNHRNKNTQIINTIFQNYGLMQYIDKATRIDETNGNLTLIDHVWARNELCIKATGTFAGISDHLGQYIKLNRSTPSPQNICIRTRNFKNYDAQAFNKDLKEQSEKNKRTT